MPRIVNATPPSPPPDVTTHDTGMTVRCQISPRFLTEVGMNANQITREGLGQDREFRCLDECDDDSLMRPSSGPSTQRILPEVIMRPSRKWLLLAGAVVMSCVLSVPSAANASPSAQPVRTCSSQAWMARWAARLGPMERYMSLKAWPVKSHASTRETAIGQYSRADCPNESRPSEARWMSPSSATRPTSW